MKPWNCFTSHSALDTHSTRPIVSIIKGALFIVWLLIANALIVAQTQARTVGTTPGELSISNGVATYTVPIAMAPGIAGMVPELSLQVSSPGGNGIAGQGGSLSGLSTISRCPKTIAQDGFTAGVNLGRKDGFCLDGQRLILVKGTYGYGGSEYRTEIESFSKITAHGSQGRGPLYFKVQTKSGQIVFYGNSTDSRLMTGSQVISWATNQIKDTTGNAIVFKYQTDNSRGEQYPREISYAGNRVSFDYESRPDKTSGYRLGSAFQINQRLKKIVVKAKSSDVRQYRLNYANTDENQTSRLDSVELCSAQGDCLQPVNFNWQEQKPYGYSTPKAASKLFGSDHWDKKRPREFGDFDGDGFIDVVGFNKDGVNFAMGSEDGVFNRNNISPYFKDRSPRNNDHNAVKWDHDDSNGNPYHPRLLGDVNGDGKTDIVGLESSYGRFKNYFKSIYIGLGDGNKIKPPKKINTNIDQQDFYVPSKDEVTLADIDGDSRADIVVFSSKGTYVAYSQGNSFAKFKKVTSLFSSGWDKDHHPRYATDINGDARADLIGFGKDGTYVALSTPNGFINKGKVLNNFGKNSYKNPSDYPRSLGDINGDGIVDIVGFARNSLQVALGKGNGTFQMLSAPGYPHFRYSEGWRGEKHIRTLADINGDGRSDIVGFKDDGVYVGLAKANFDKVDLWGIGVTPFGSPQKSLNSFGYNKSAGEWRVDKNPRMLMDVDGNGSADILGFGQDGIEVATNSFDGKPSRIDSISDGFGVETHINYRRLSDNSVYKPSTANSSYPTLRIKSGPQLLVSSVHAEDGQGGKLTTSYRYGDMQVNLQGRGPLGFAWTETKQQTSGITHRIEYHQQWPYSGMPKKAQQTVKGKLVSKSENSLALRKQWNNKVQFPYVKQTIEKTWELNGHLISKVTTKNDNPDPYGNFKTVKVITEGGGKTFTQTTQSEYNNNTYLWHLGRLSKATVTHQGNGATQIRTSRFEYHSKTGLLTKEIVEPHHEKQLTTQYSYDSAGNKTTVTITGKGLSGRTSKTFYDSNKQFATGSSNALGHSESRRYDPRFGVVTNLVGPNKLTTQWNYDSFGRKITERRADGNSTHWRRQWASDCQSAHPKAVWCLEVKKSGAGLSNTQFDKLGRQVRAVATGFDGRHSLIDKQYDRQGREYKVSQPYFEGDQVHWTESFFDELSRVKKVTTLGPQGYQINVRTDYNGLETIVTNAKGQSKTTTTNVMGKVVKVLEPLGASVDYTYDALGNLLTTKDAKGLVTRLEYDQRGHKIKMVDPAMGTWYYRYNAAGELIWQKDAKQQTVDLKYDALGRLIERKEPEGTSRWIYDKGHKGIGKLTEVTSPGIKRSQTYDSMGRPSNTTTEADGKTLNLSQQYDQFGRVKTVNYPMGFEVIRDYNQHGYLTAVKSPLSLIQDYQRRHIDTLLDEVLDRIEEAQKKADQYYADAARYRTKARQYQQTVEDFERYASYNRNQANHLKSVANSNEAIAKRERNAQAADQRAANVKKAIVTQYNNVAKKLRNAADRNQASARDDYNRARALDSEAAALERSVKIKKSAGNREYRAARIDSKTAKRLREAAKRLKKTAAKLEKMGERYQRYADRRYNAVTRFSRRCAGRDANSDYCIRYKRNKLNAYKSNSAKARNYLERAKKLRQQAATYQVQARGKYNEARKHQQKGAQLIGQSKSAEHQAKTKRKQADQLQAQAKHKNSVANIQEIYVSYSEGIAKGANSQANNSQAKANQHASRAQQAENRAKSQRAQANSNDKAAVALDQRAKHYLSLVNAELRKAESAVANAERYAQEVKQLEATASGYQAIQGDQEHAVFWRAQGRDAAGRLNHVVHGNGLTTQWAYNQATGTLDRIRTGLSWDPIRELEYEYDNNSNVKRRSDITNDINESFNYDALDRLDDSTVYSSSNSSGAYNKTIDYRYDLNGNITYKTDVGSYSYNGAHLIHAGSKHRNYRYDANGNIASGGGRRFSWSSFNKPTQINKDNAQVNFSYDADRKRYKRVDNLNGTTTTTLYLGKTYEQIKTGNHTTHKYFVYAGDQLAAIHFDKLDSSGDQSDYQTRYLHADALGSVDLITDGVGQIVDKLSYDPFGKRRPSNWRVSTQPAYATLAPILTNRGFTGHEHVDAVSIIHMNGRIYDAELGRFLSADPTMQFPYSTQGQNRYAYVQNNPLKYVDMNGYGLFTFFKKLRDNKYFRLIVAIAAAYFVGAAVLNSAWAASAGAKYAAVASGAAGGATFGFIASGGDVKAALKGAITGAAFGWVGDLAKAGEWNTFQTAMAHGTVGGTSGRLNGGSFKDGFVGSFFAVVLNPIVKTKTGMGKFVKRTLLGGASAKLGGGKFANGALSAGMGYLFNHCSHDANCLSTKEIPTDPHLAYATNKEINRLNSLTTEQYESLMSQYGYEGSNQDDITSDILTEISRLEVVKELQQLKIYALRKSLAPNAADVISPGFAAASEISPRLGLISSIFDSITFLKWVSPYINDTTYNYQYSCKRYNCDLVSVSQ